MSMYSVARNRPALRRAVAICSVLAVISARTAAAGIFLPPDIQPGFDLYQTPSGTASFSSIPIPGGFFDPGSDPFSGTAMLSGSPVGPGDTDTIIQRLGDLSFGMLPDMGTIPIEIVALHLVSVNPITVTYNGGQNPEPWNVEVTLSPTQQQGMMTVTKTHANGGTFTADLPVRPVFTFTRASPMDMVTLDGPTLGDTLHIMNGTWTHAPPPNYPQDAMYPAGDFYPDPMAMGDILTLTWAPASVPEPSAWLMLGVVAAGMGVIVATCRAVRDAAPIGRAARPMPAREAAR